MVVGILFGAWKTRGFRSALIDFDYQEHEAQANPAVSS
jgi:hypothetical protein